MDDHCAVGLWCNKTDIKCAKLPSIGEKCDLGTGPPCPYNAMCHLGTDGSRTCVRKGTLENGVAVDRANRDLCKTFSSINSGN